MGKPKKGKKGRQDDDFGDDDIDIDPLANKEEIEEVVPAKSAKPGKKGKKKKNDDWEDDVAAEIAEMSLQQKQDDSDMNGEAEVIPQPKAKKKDKKKSKKKVESEEEEDMDGDEVELTGSKPYGGKNVAAFSMLGMDDSLDEPSSDEEQEVVKQEKSEKDVKKQKSVDEDQEGKSNQQQKKKGKKEKKKKKDDEEDIDALLAEIQGNDKGIEFKDMSSMTQEEIAKAMEAEYEDDDDDKKKKKKKKKGGQEEEKQENDEDENEGDEGEDDEEGGTVKTAAQKKKEKKERQKQKKLEEKAKQKNKKNKEATEGSQAEVLPEEPVQAAKEEKLSEETKNEDEEDKKPDEEGAEEDEKKKKKKDRRKKKGEKEEEKETKKKPSKMAMMIQEQQKKIKEEEERIRLEMEEKERKIEEAHKAKEEQERKLKEKKEREKQKKKEKIEKQKKDGTFLTAKQREQQKRAQAMLEARRAQGYIVPGDEVPEEVPKKKKPIYEKKKKKPLTSQDSFNKEKEEVTPTEEKSLVIEKPVEKEKETKKEEPKDSWDASDDEVKDSWDAESDTEEKGTKKGEKNRVSESRVSESSSKRDDDELSEDDDDDEESSEEEDSEEDEDSSEEESSSDEDDLTAAEKARQKAEKRIQKRKETAEKNRTTDDLRAAVVVVLGHVDTGKTKILDKLRRTNVQDNEAGGITQQIGATNVPVHAIKDSTKMCKDFAKQELKLPGLLIIDTPGHESFSNLRSRGSSLCDISILVVDIMHGLEPQTIESINLLKERKCPFIVALNKIDRLYGWQSNPHSDVVNVIKKQKQNTKLEFEERAQQVMVQFAEQGLNAKLFYENKNPKEYISMVPTSAHSGDGMGNLVALICELSQTHLAKKLAYSEELQATVMEVKAIHGLGTTIDVILVNGKMNEGDTIIVPGTEGPIVTQIRGLLMPQPMKELRVKNAYEHHKEVKAAQGVKIIAKDLDHSLAGLPVYVAHFADEIDIHKEEVKRALEDILSSIKLKEKGVYVQASTLGSLEALLQFLKDSKIPYAGINIGPVHKRDVMKLSVMLDRDPQYAVLLAFDVKVEREAQELADNLGIRVFSAEIIYHLFDSFMAYRDEYKKSKQDEFKHIAVFPCKLRVLPQCIFNSRDPIVMGVAVEAGFVKMGTPICVPSKENVLLGHITSLEVNHKQIEKATKGQEVCIKIDNLPSETPKLYGRHFDHTDMLVSKISRESIDAVKNYFRDEMSKNDWQLILELKKMFQIL